MPSSSRKDRMDLELEATRGPGSILTGGNIFH